MTEIQILQVCLLFALLLAPRMTSVFFLPLSTHYVRAHAIALLLLSAAFALPFPPAALAWPAFCVFGLLLYLKDCRGRPFSVRSLPAGIPFAFSIISSLWLIAGVFDAHLLGYNRAWSFYAALHGSVLGWLLVGCFARLAQGEPRSSLYTFATYLSLPLFLLVAFGIDGVPYIKRIGVVAFSLLVPLVVFRYASGVQKRGAARWAGLSAFALICSMGLALLNEFWPGFPRVVAGVPTMVVTHGLLNALVAVPCFFLALRLEKSAG